MLLYSAELEYFETVTYEVGLVSVRKFGRGLTHMDDYLKSGWLTTEGKIVT